MRKRRACCADSARIRFHRSARFPAAAIRPFSLRSAASGTISSAPSSVAFSIAHSNRSNFTMARSNSIRTADTGAASCSTSENSTSSRPTLSVRASHTRCPVTQLIQLPGLGAQHAPQMVRRFAAQRCGTRFKFFHKESPSHGPLCYINPMRIARPAGLCPAVHGLFRIFPGDSRVFLCRRSSALKRRRRPSPFRRAVIIDTDAGQRRPDGHRVPVVPPGHSCRGHHHRKRHGARTGRRKKRPALLALAGRNDIPVFLGRETPLSGSQEFPAEWRKASDELPGITLPEPARDVDPRGAADFLLKRLADAAHPVQVLALGPLTNLAEVFSHTPRAARTGRQLVIMGGAVRVSGDLGDGGFFKTENDSAEWNMFIDPAAAKIVFQFRRADSSGAARRHATRSHRHGAV